MVSALRRIALDTYAKSIEREITDPPAHVAIIQDGNRRFASRRGQSVRDGHRAGADTAERVLAWCRDLGIRELTLYAFSTENFDRPAAERDHLFDLLAEKLREFANAPETTEHEVCIEVIGDTSRLPERVREAVRYAEEKTDHFDQYKLNVAVAYGGRLELLTAAQEVASAVESGSLSPAEIDIQTIDERLYGADVRDVDLIIRTGGDERTSNFLPWHANGNEAAVYFCTPYWPEFTKVDFLRAIRTYQYREHTWHQTRIQRATALVRAFSDLELPIARRLAQSVRTDAEAQKAAALPADSTIGTTETAD